MSDLEDLSNLRGIFTTAEQLREIDELNQKQSQTGPSSNSDLENLSAFSMVADFLMEVLEENYRLVPFTLMYKEDEERNSFVFRLLLNEDATLLDKQLHSSFMLDILEALYSISMKTGEDITKLGLGISPTDGLFVVEDLDDLLTVLEEISVARKFSWDRSTVDDKLRSQLTISQLRQAVYGLKIQRKIPVLQNGMVGLYYQ